MMKELPLLPGVVRKSASGVLAWCFGINAVVSVDTHASRLSQRLKLSRNSDPGTVEPNRKWLVPHAEWPPP